MDSPGFDILYEQGPCLVVVKPGGVLTQAPPGIDSLEARIKRFLEARNGSAQRVYLGVPHRLDRPVSGAMVFGLNVRATRRLAEQFEDRSVQKTYWAVVQGEVHPEQGTWTDYVRKVYGEPRAETVEAGHPEGRIALLHYRVLRREPAWSWLEIELETGRTHQIRIQSASRGFPILGDELYTSQQPFGPQTVDQRLRWIALHGRRLSFRHPVTREVVSTTAPVSEPWQAFTGSGS
jgi:RluA family pseudouridine synthase